MKHRATLGAGLLDLGAGLFLSTAQALGNQAPGMGSCAIRLSSATDVGTLLTVQLAWDVAK